MLRYRCQHCSQLLQAHELRAGKKSVCNTCLTSHVIPADPAEWLNELGEPLHPRQPIAVQPALEPVAAVASSVAAAVPEPAGVALDPASVVEPEPPVEPPPGPESKTPVVTNPPRVAAASHTPPPVTRTSVRVTVTHPGEQAGYGTPVSASTQADIAAALTAALTRRMKPPREPRHDLRLSTAAWLLLTGIGIAFLLATLISGKNYSTVALVLGLVQVAAGYAWIVYLTWQREPKRGLLCALPPITCYYLAQKKYAKLRPARFVVSGLVIALAGLALLTPEAIADLRNWARMGRRPTTTAPDPTALSHLEELRSYREAKAHDKLIELLRTLTQTDALLSEDAKNRAELSAEMKSLCSHPHIGVKVAAMAAYARWGGDDALDICIHAVQSESSEERLMAIQLLPQWKESRAVAEVARAVASLIGRPGVESSRAKAALEEIGGPAAERAALAVLFRSTDRGTQLVALTTLEAVGGAESVAELTDYAKRSLDVAIKTKAQDTITAIQNRPKNKK